MSLFSTFRTEKKLQGKDKKKWSHKNGSKPINIKTADTLSCFPLKRANTVLYTHPVEKVHLQQFCLRNKRHKIIIDT